MHVTKWAKLASDTVLTIHRIFVVDDEHSIATFTVSHDHGPLVDGNLLPAA